MATGGTQDGGYRHPGSGVQISAMTRRGGGADAQEAGGGGQGGWVDPFRTKGGDQYHRPTCAQVRGGQRALAGGRRSADQDGGKSVQGRVSAVAAVGLSGSDGSSRAW